MDIAFKNALIISIVIHSAIITPVYRITAPLHNTERQKQMLVDYVRLKGLRTSEAHKAKKEEMPMGEAREDIIVKPVDRIAEMPKKTVQSKEAPQDTAKAQAGIKSTKDYVNYFQFVRERIRHRLKANYTDRRNEGDVRLEFVLSSNGSLISVAVEGGSTDDKTLIDIATLSIKEASPFPAFPKALKVPSMSFNLVVSFKKE